MKLATITTEADHAAVQEISARIIGWSTDAHYYFFKALLEANPDAKTILILGVYYGRDIAFILDILARYHPGRVVEIVGVDRFSAEPCADWPEGVKTWEELTGGMPAPDIRLARANLDADNVLLVGADDAGFLEDVLPRWDIIHVDTAHDQQTVARQLRQIRGACAGQRTVICGDDYRDGGSQDKWGVKSAVEAAFHQHWVFQGWIWYSFMAHLKPRSLLNSEQQVHTSPPMCGTMKTTIPFKPC